MGTAPTVYVIGGPNGAGKTTFANRFLPATVSVKQFVNADLIAKGLSPFDPDSVAIAAGRLMLQRIEDLARQGVDFALESTLSAKTLASRLKALRQSGYRVSIVYLWLDSPELALARVARRVEEGGHNVPEETVRRRYFAGIRNFLGLCRPLADHWVMYDNSSQYPVLVAYGDKDGSQVEDARRYGLIERMATP